MNIRRAAQVTRGVRLAAAIAACGLAGGVLASTPAEAESSSGKYYSITNANLSVRALTGNLAGAVSMSPYTGDSGQHWHWEPDPLPGMRLVNKKTGQCLNAEPTGQVTTKPCNGGLAQAWLWRYSSVGGSTELRLSHVASDRVITVSLDKVKVLPPTSYANPNQELKSTFRGRD